MKTILTALAVTALLAGFLSRPAAAGREVEPGDLKVSPARYRNASIVVRDIYIHRRAGIPPALTAAGYTLDKYILIGLRNSGMPCFLRRTAENEKLVAGLENGQRITVRGTVRQPRARPPRERGRGSEGMKLDLYLVEAGQVEAGWE